MKKTILLSITAALLGTGTIAKTANSLEVPAVVKQGLAKKYPNASKVTWEKEKGNYEANWGGKSGEDTSVTFTPAGEFVEEVDANGRVVITVSDGEGNPECNGFGATRLEATKDLYEKGYHIVFHHERRGNKNIWKTQDPS